MAATEAAPAAEAAQAVIDPAEAAPEAGAETAAMNDLEVSKLLSHAFDLTTRRSTTRPSRFSGPPAPEPGQRHGPRASCEHLRKTGQSDAAVRQMKRAVDLNPESRGQRAPCALEQRPQFLRPRISPTAAAVQSRVVSDPADVLALMSRGGGRACGVGVRRQGARLYAVTAARCLGTATDPAVHPKARCDWQRRRSSRAARAASARTSGWRSRLRPR